MVRSTILIVRGCFGPLCGTEETVAAGFASLFIFPICPKIAWQMSGRNSISSSRSIWLIEGVLKTCPSLVIGETVRCKLSDALYLLATRLCVDLTSYKISCGISRNMPSSNWLNDDNVFIASSLFDNFDTGWFFFLHLQVFCLPQSLVHLFSCAFQVSSLLRISSTTPLRRCKIICFERTHDDFQTSTKSLSTSKLK